jgi:hypothetical protein
MPAAIVQFSAPAVGAANVTPSDTVSFANGACRSLWIGGAGSGNLSVLMADGTTGTFSGVPVGIMPISCVRVNSTGTDVTAIDALY